MNIQSKVAIIIYSILVTVGGLIGFIKAGSKASLFTSAATAITLIASLQILKDNPRSSYFFSCGMTLILSIFFYIRFVNSGYVFMPGGLMLIISFAVFCLVAINIFKENRPK